MGKQAVHANIKWLVCATLPLFRIGGSSPQPTLFFAPETALRPLGTQAHLRIFSAPAQSDRERKLVREGSHQVEEHTQALALKIFHLLLDACIIRPKKSPLPIGLYQEHRQKKLLVQTLKLCLRTKMLWDQGQRLEDLKSGSVAGVK